MEQNFEQGFEEYVTGALVEEENKRYRCAVDLYYKAVCQLIDYLLFKKGIDISKLKDRLDEIRVLNSDVHNIYRLIHLIYRSAYKIKKDKGDCKEIKNGIKQIIFLKKVEGRFKEVAEKI